MLEVGTAPGTGVVPNSCAGTSGVGHHVVPQSRKILTERVICESRTFRNLKLCTILVVGRHFYWGILGAEVWSITACSLLKYLSTVLPAENTWRWLMKFIFQIPAPET